MSEYVPAIGIDLGTTNSCVGVYRNGRVEVIANDRGSRLTPSVVAFTEDEILIGDPAKMQQSFNPRNTVYEVKRLIGRKYDDDSVQKSIKHWPFAVTNNNGNPNLKVKDRLSDRTFTPEQISAMILGKVKKIAETYLGCEVRKAVITVPAYFTDSQRQATIDAGTIAGLEVLKIINEPTAAALAYGENVRVWTKKNILIFDFGGGTFDVSILTVNKGEYDVKVVRGNNYLGGTDLDTLICKYLMEKIFGRTTHDVSQDPRALSKIRKAAEQAKISLSCQKKARIQIENLFQGRDVDTFISRPKFEEICLDLFNETMTCVDNALDDAGMTPGMIDDVVLVGGSAWIPKVEQMMKHKFANIKRNINPAEAVAHGAAIQAAMLNKDCTLQNMILSEVTPHSLGVSLHGDRMSTIIKRYTKIPAKYTVSKYTTIFDFQKTINFPVCEGESPIASKNNKLGELKAEGIEIAKTGIPSVDITFELDSNGILNATAVDCKTGGGGHVTIFLDKGRLAKNDIDKMMMEMKEINLSN